MIYIFFGENRYKLYEELNKIKARFLSGKKLESELKEIGLDDFSEEDLGQYFQVGSLFSTRKMVIFKDILEYKKIDIFERVQEYIEKIKDNRDIVVIFREGEKIDKRKKFVKYLLGIAEIKQFDKPNDLEVKQWVVSRFKKEGIQAEDAVLLKLIELTRGDMYVVSNETEKIISYIRTCESEGKKELLTVKTIEELVNAEIEENIFKLIENLGGRNKKVAFKMLDELLSQGVDYHYVLSMMIYQLRSMMLVKTSLDSNSGDSRAVAKETGLHPFSVQKIIPAVRIISEDKLKILYQKIMKADLLFKSKKTNPHLILDLLLMV